MNLVVPWRASHIELHRSWAPPANGELDFPGGSPVQGDRSRGSRKSIDRDSIGRVCGGIEAQPAGGIAAGVVVALNQGEAADTIPGVNGKGGIKVTADSVKQNRGVRWSRPTVPDRMATDVPVVGGFIRFFSGTDVVAGDGSGARRRPEDCREHPQGGRLPGAIRSEQAEDLARARAEGKPFDGMHGTAALVFERFR